MPYRKAVEILCKNIDRDPLNFHVYFIKKDKNLEGFSKSVFQSTKVIINCSFCSSCYRQNFVSRKSQFLKRTILFPQGNYTIVLWSCVKILNSSYFKKMIVGLETSNTFLCKVQWKQWLCKKKGYEKVKDNLKTKQKMDVRKRVRQTM